LMRPIHDERIVVICRNCGAVVGPIFLPEPNRPDIPEGPSVITRGGVPENIACPECAHVYGYRTSDFQIHLLGTPDLRAIRPDRVSVCATRLCAVRNCESLVAIHTAAAFGVSRDELRQIASQWIFEARCLEGHELRKAPPMEYEFEIHKGGGSPAADHPS
jgi:hypothetical protein